MIGAILFRFCYQRQELGAQDVPVKELAEVCCANGPVGHLVELQTEDVSAIFEASL